MKAISCWRRHAYLGLAWLGLWCWPGTSPASEPPLSVIFDTDLGNDCDDVAAMFVLHGAIERGEIRLLATMGCTSAETIAPAIDAINSWFGRPDIPVGTLKDTGLLSGGGYTAELAARFPHARNRSADYPDAVSLYRQVLASQPDRSVVVLAVGPLRNLANLLKSPADQHSPLDGTALIRQKVSRLDVMGGKYPPQPSRHAAETEWNFEQDPTSAALVCESWPTEILFNGEGGSTNCGRRVTFELPEHNPLTLAFTAYPGVGYAGDRLSWDPVSCLVTVRGAAPWYTVVQGGGNLVAAKNGRNVWQTEVPRNDAYLVFNPELRKQVVEAALEELMVTGVGHPTGLKFDTTGLGIRGATCSFRSSTIDATPSDVRAAFDGDDSTKWVSPSATSWVECQYHEGRKYSVSSVVLTSPHPLKRPDTVVVLASNDDGATWQTLRSSGLTTRTVATSSHAELALDNPQHWSRYRVMLTALPGEGEAEVALSTLQLIESIDCNPAVPVRSIALDQTAVALRTLERVTLNAQVAPIDAYDRQVRWTNSDSRVATVRPIGEHSAVVVGRTAGTCTISASVTSTIAGSVQAGSTEPVTVTSTTRVIVTPADFPSGWTLSDLNDPAIPGSVRLQDGVLSLTGCGHAMTSWWERVRDQGAFFHHGAIKSPDVEQRSVGQFELTARFQSLGPNAGGPNAYPFDNRPPSCMGLMIRESLDQPAGRFVLVQVEASGALVGRWRDKTNDQDDNQRRELGQITLPATLKLTYHQGVVSVFSSPNGSTWGEPLFTHTAQFDEESRCGLFVCSGNPFATTTAIIDDWQFQSLSVTP